LTSYFVYPLLTEGKVHRVAGGEVSHVYS